MDRCPTCGARHRGEPQCHRCHTDVRQVLLIERAAAALRRQARGALEQGRTTEARSYASRAEALHRCPEALAVRALIALRGRDFPLALRLWRESHSSASDAGSPSAGAP